MHAHRFENMKYVDKLCIANLELAACYSVNRFVSS